MGDSFISPKIDALHQLLLSNSLKDWLTAGSIAVAVWSALWIVRRLVVARYKKFPATQRHIPMRLVAYLIGNTKLFFLLAVALDTAQASLTLPDEIQRFVSNAVMILILLQVGLWAGRSVRF